MKHTCHPWRFCGPPKLQPIHQALTPSLPSSETAARSWAMKGDSSPASAVGAASNGASFLLAVLPLLPFCPACHLLFVVAMIVGFHSTPGCRFFNSSATAWLLLMSLPLCDHSSRTARTETLSPCLQLNDCHLPPVNMQLQGNSQERSVPGDPCLPQVNNTALPPH